MKTLSGLPNDGVAVVQEIMHKEEQAQTPMVPGGFMSIIEKAAALDNIDVDKLERMMQMQLQWEDRQAEVAFNDAMSKVAARMKDIKIVRRRGVSYDKGDVKKDAFKYAAIEDIDKLVAPILTEENVTISFDTEPSATAGWHNIIIRVSHGRHTKSAKVPLPLDTSGGKNSTQGMGSTYSYGKRYALCAFFNIVTIGEDDDGSGGAIDDAQAAHIKNLIRESGADTGRFLKYMHAENVEAVLFKDYRKATSMLEEKLAKKKKTEVAHADTPPV